MQYLSNDGRGVTSSRPETCCFTAFDNYVEASVHLYNLTNPYYSSLDNHVYVRHCTVAITWWWMHESRNKYQTKTFKSWTLTDFKSMNSDLSIDPWANPLSKDDLLMIMASSISYPWNNEQLNISTVETLLNETKEYDYHCF